MAKRKRPEPTAGVEPEGEQTGRQQRATDAGDAQPHEEATEAEAVGAARRDGLTDTDAIAAYVKKFYGLHLTAAQVARHPSRDAAGTLPKPRRQRQHGGAEPAPEPTTPTSTPRAQPAPRKPTPASSVGSDFVNDMCMLADLHKRYGSRQLADMLKVFDRLK